MPRMILCLVLLMGALSPLTAQPPATPAPAAPASASDTMVTLGPDTLTFPEIAQRLSVGGRKVTCSPALEQFAAYVYLKPRSWEKTSRLLEQGLQVQLVPGKNDPNHFTLEWDQDTRRRERAWLSRFSGNLLQYLQEKMAVRADYFKQPPNALRQQYDSANAEVEAFYKQNDFSKSTPHVRQQIKLCRDMYPVVNSGNGEQLGLLWAQNNMPTQGEIAQAIRQGVVYRVQETGQMPPDLVNAIAARNPLLSREEKKPLFRYLAEAWKLGSSSSALGFSSQARMMSLNEFGFSLPMELDAQLPPLLQDQEPSLIQWVFAGVPEGDQRRFIGLGRAAMQWLQAEQKRTRAALTKARTLDGGAFNPNDGSGDQSRRLEAWSRRKSVEAIGVVWPLREESTRGVPGGKPLTDTSKTSDADAPDPSGQWEMEETDGVWRVQNLMAFLDRERMLPTAALIEFARPEQVTEKTKTPANPEQAVEPAWNYEKLRRYCKAVENAPLPFWRYPMGLAGYRGVSASALDESVGAMFLWERLSPKERAVLWEQGRKAYAANFDSAAVPLTRFDPRDRARFARIMQGWGMEYIQANLPGFADALSGCTLYMRVSPEGANRPTRIRLEVRGPEGSGFDVRCCDAQFFWQP